MHDCCLLQELANRIVGLTGTLNLGYVSAVELHVMSAGQHVGDMPREGDRDQSVAATPHEQRVGLQLAQPRPETLLAWGSSR